MCFTPTSRPPIAPILGGALDGRRIELVAGDGTHLSAYRARAAGPDRRRDRDPAGRTRPVHVLRGAGAAVRRGGHRCGRHRLLRADGRRQRPARATSSTCPTSPGRPGRGCLPDIAAAVAYLRSADGGAVRSVVHASGSASAVGWRSTRRPWASGWPASSASTACRRGRVATTRPPRSRWSTGWSARSWACSARADWCHPPRDGRRLRGRSRAGQGGPPDRGVRGRSALVLRSFVRGARRRVGGRLAAGPEVHRRRHRRRLTRGARARRPPTGGSPSHRSKAPG